MNDKHRHTRQLPCRLYGGSAWLAVWPAMQWRRSSFPLYSEWTPDRHCTKSDLKDRTFFCSCSAITFLSDSGCHALPSLPTNQTISSFGKQCIRKGTESGITNSLTNSTLFDNPWYNKLMSKYMGMCSRLPHQELSEDKMDIAFSKRNIYKSW